MDRLTKIMLGILVLLITFIFFFIVTNKGQGYYYTIVCDKYGNESTEFYGWTDSGNCVFCLDKEWKEGVNECWDIIEVDVENGEILRRADSKHERGID